MDRRYRAWPDERLPALGDRTPRELVKTPEGRREVADLLTFFEENPVDTAEDRSVAYDFGWLWDELGIEELRGGR